MYIRFVCAVAHPHADAELGIYRALSLVDLEAQPAWLIEDYERAFRVLRGLDVPPCVCAYCGTADGLHALCWLRAEHRARVRAFRHLSWVIGEMGLPMAEIVTRDPGRIIYRDEAQVVALPRGPIPRAFPRRPRPGVCVVRTELW